MIHKKVWGSEEWLVNNELYCAKILKIDPMKRCSMHHHITKDETFIVREGGCLLEYSPKNDFTHKEIKLVKHLEVGDSIRIYPLTPHRFWSVKGCQILEVSTRHLEKDSYRETESGEFTIVEYMNFLSTAVQKGK